MMGLIDLPRDIKAELTKAQLALAENNIGKARVCARRAVGKAFLLSSHNKGDDGSTGANEIIKRIAASENVRPETKEAASRLSASVAQAELVSQHPIEDALKIISELLGF